MDPPPKPWQRLPPGGSRGEANMLRSNPNMPPSGAYSPPESPRGGAGGPGENGVGGSGPGGAPENNDIGNAADASSSALALPNSTDGQQITPYDNNTTTYGPNNALDNTDSYGYGASGSNYGGYGGSSMYGGGYGG